MAIMMINADTLLAKLMNRRRKYIEYIKEFEKVEKENDIRSRELKMQLFEINVFIGMIQEEKLREML